MEAVKKSIYLDSDLVEPLKLSAKRDGRSVTRQINILLRNGLAVGEQHRGVTALRPGFRGPDPKVKKAAKKSPSKKLT